jgi:hypothetical protein
LISWRDIGNGRPVYFVITVDTEIITGGNPVRSISNWCRTRRPRSPLMARRRCISIPGRSSRTIRREPDQLNAGGVIFCGALPLEGKPFERYLGVLAVIATTTVTAGKINAYLTLDPPAWKAYANSANA